MEVGGAGGMTPGIASALGAKMYERKPLVTLHPVDRMLRFVVGLIILGLAYALDMPTLKFAFLHMVTSYIWVTVMIAWDPFYFVVARFRQIIKDRDGMNGRF